MAAGVYDFVVEQDATFRQRITWAAKQADGTTVAYDLTGCTAFMQVRAGYDVIPEFVTLTSANGGLTLGGTAGTIDIFMTPVQTNSLTTKRPRYDLVVTFPGGDTRRVLEGRMLVSKWATLPNPSS